MLSRSARIVLRADRAGDGARCVVITFDANNDHTEN